MSINSEKSIEKVLARSDSQIYKPQRGRPERAELPDVNINTCAQSNNTESFLKKNSFKIPIFENRKLFLEKTKRDVVLPPWKSLTFTIRRISTPGTVCLTHPDSRASQLKSIVAYKTNLVGKYS